MALAKKPAARTPRASSANIDDTYSGSGDGVRCHVPVRRRPKLLDRAIQPDLTNFVDDHCSSRGVFGGQEVAQQRGLAAAEKSGEDDEVECRGQDRAGDGRAASSSA